MKSSSTGSQSPCGDVASARRIAQSLEHYESSARFDVASDAIDYMQAMHAVAKCSHPHVADLILSHQNKRKAPKRPQTRYCFSAALESYAMHVQTSAMWRCAPQTARERMGLVQQCMLRAERSLLLGYARDPDHVHAKAYFAANPTLASWTLANVATRATLASLHKARLPPALHAPLSPDPPRLAAPPSSCPADIVPCSDLASMQSSLTNGKTKLPMLPPPPRPPTIAGVKRKPESSEINTAATPTSRLRLTASCPDAVSPPSAPSHKGFGGARLHEDDAVFQDFLTAVVLDGAHGLTGETHAEQSHDAGHRLVAEPKTIRG